MEALYENIFNLQWQQVVMWVFGGLLIFLAIKKEMEPTLLLPLGFGAIMVNLPMSGAVAQMVNGALEEGPLSTLYNAGIANELFPLILFIGIGAMIDFGPILSNPKLMVFGAAAQFGIFFTLCVASMFFPQNDAASIAIIGAADGPTSIVVAQKLKSQYIGAIMVAAYSYMALVPIIQPPVIKLLTTKKERLIRMPYHPAQISKTTRILFPIIITIITGIVAPSSVSLVGFLMFGNLIRECGVLDSLSETAQKVLANLVTIFLGITIASQMQAEQFLKPETLLILGSRTLRVYIRHRGRRHLREDTEPLLKGKDQPDDRRGRYIRVPDVRTYRSHAGKKRRPRELPAYAFDRRQCIRSDRVGNRGRTHTQFLYVTETR